MLARQSLGMGALGRIALPRADGAMSRVSRGSRGMAMTSCSGSSRAGALGAQSQSAAMLRQPVQSMSSSLRTGLRAPRIAAGPIPSPARSGIYAIQARNFSLWPSSSPKAPAPAATAPPVTPETRAPATSSATLPDVAAAEGHGVNEGVEAATQAATGSVDHVVTLADMTTSWWPNVRAAQYLTDWVVETTGLPWWANIAIVTIGVRILVMPLVLRGQTNAIRLANINPKMQGLMKDMSYAKSAGDQRLMAESAQKVQQLMKENDCHPLRSLITPLVQAPIFISFFFGLRSFAEQGLTSMKTGGLAWFPDLTAADPNMILPVVSAASMLLIIETGAELGGTAQQNTPQAKMTRNVLRGLSVVMIPFIWNFPAAVFCYWLTNNTFSLLQLLVLRTEPVRRALKIPERIDHKQEDDGTSGPRTKPMSFWDNITAGKDSQTASPANARNVGRNGMPTVLQDQRRAEQARERALQRMMNESGVQDKSGAASEGAAEGTSSTKPVAATTTSRAQNRVQAARERRQKRAQR